MPNMSVDQYRTELKKPENLSRDFALALQIFATEDLNNCQKEYRFHPTRKWRFDFAWPRFLVAVECDGMVWQAGGGRHNSDADREKINTATMMGWRVLRFSGNQIKTDPVGCIEMLTRTIEWDGSM